MGKVEKKCGMRISDCGMGSGLPSTNHEPRKSAMAKRTHRVASARPRWGYDACCRVRRMAGGWTCRAVCGQSMIDRRFIGGMGKTSCPQRVPHSCSRARVLSPASPRRGLGAIARLLASQSDDGLLAHLDALDGGLERVAIGPGLLGNQTCY